MEELVHGYPSHDYIIDYHELKEMGFSVSLFSKSEHVAMRGLFKVISDGKPVVELVLPEERESQSRQSADLEAAKP